MCTYITRYIIKLIKKKKKRNYLLVLKSFLPNKFRSYYCVLRLVALLLTTNNKSYSYIKLLHFTQEICICNHLHHLTCWSKCKNTIVMLLKDLDMYHRICIYVVNCMRTILFKHSL